MRSKFFGIDTKHRTLGTLEVWLGDHGTLVTSYVLVWVLAVWSLFHLIPVDATLIQVSEPVAIAYLVISVIVFVLLLLGNPRVKGVGNEILAIAFLYGSITYFVLYGPVPLAFFGIGCYIISVVNFVSYRRETGWIIY